MFDRDVLGRVVREAWVRWALAQPNPKPSWLVPYDQLSESDKEADRVIAEGVLDHLNGRRLELAERKSRGELLQAEEPEFSALQEGVFAALDVKFPRPPADLARLEELEARLRAGGT